MKRHIVIILSIIALLLMSLVTTAQESGDLYFTNQGDIWVWNPSMSAPEQLTEWGFNGSPVLSPDGSRFAYASVSTEAVESIGDPDVGSYYVFAHTPANNIWIMETANRDFERIADQSAGFPILRGLPTWSPDSNELAWIEYSLVNEYTITTQAQLVVYNFNTETTRVVSIVNLGFQDAGISLPRVQWGEGGISYRIFTYVESGGVQHQLYVVDPATGNTSQFILVTTDDPFADVERIPSDIIWVDHDGQSMLAILYNDGLWILLNPTNGTQVELAQAPSLVPRNGIGARITPMFVTNNDFNEIRWQATSTNNITRDLQHTSFGLTMRVPAMSPTGELVITVDEFVYDYQRIDGVNDSGTIQAVPPATPYMNLEVETAVWTPMRWVTNGTVGEPLPTQPPSTPNTGSTACQLPELFASGDFITVQAGAPNNVRANPSINANYTISLYSGDLVSVQGEPVCADGFRWWNISGEGGFSGWTAEGSSDGTEA
ncbi:MAG: hypothetical protein AAFV93_24115, partial [Chloroflexota bacterium]